MPITFRSAKLEKFINEKVKFMEMQQSIIESVKKQDVPIEFIYGLETNQNAIYNTVFDLCREFGIEMPHVLGVTPK